MHAIFPLGFAVGQGSYWLRSGPNQGPRDQATFSGIDGQPDVWKNFKTSQNLKAPPSNCSELDAGGRLPSLLASSIDLKGSA